MQHVLNRLRGEALSHHGFSLVELQKFFGKSREEAENIMLQVHKEGRGIAGIFNFETAETKMHLVNTYSDISASITSFLSSPTTTAALIWR